MLQVHQLTSILAKESLQAEKKLLQPYTHVQLHDSSPDDTAQPVLS